MRTLLSIVAVAACSVVPGLARADAPPAAACARKATVPAWMERVARQESVPAVYQEKQRAICETCEEPVYENRCVPQTVNEVVPLYELRPTPVYETRKVPVFGEVDVPVFGDRCVHVKVPWFHPCACEEKPATLFKKTEKIRVGTKRERRLLGYREEKVQVGTRNERIQCGQQVTERVCGWKTEQVCVGTKVSRRVVGYEPHWVEVSPATTRTVQELVAHPARIVTVVPDGTARVLLPGTDTVMTEAEFAAACRAARGR